MRHIVIVMFLLLPCLSFAAGPNDGIYQFIDSGNPEVTNLGFVSIHQNGDILAYIDLDLEIFEFAVYSGTRAGNIATMELAATNLEVSSSFTLEFLTDNDIRITIIECTAGEGVTCNTQAGEEFNLVKVF